MKYLLALSVFTLSFSALKAQTQPAAADSTIYRHNSIDKDPDFPGGMESFYKYFATHIQYPEEAKKNPVSGMFFVSFVVERDGSLSNVTPREGLSKELDKEVTRVITASPKWNPGKKNGKAVRVAYVVPIKFSLK